MMDNLSTQAGVIQKGAEDEANALNTYSLEMSSELNRFEMLTPKVTQFSNPKPIWDLLQNHLTMAIQDCDTLLAKIKPTQQKVHNRLAQLQVKLALKDSAVCANTITDTVCIDTPKDQCLDTPL